MIYLCYRPGNCEYFSTSSLANGFHQNEVDPKDAPKTALSAENGHYEFLRKPFGLKNACAPFTELCRI